MAIETQPNAQQSLEQQTLQWLQERSGLSQDQLAQDYLAHHQAVVDKRESYAQQGILVSYRMQAPQLQYLPREVQEKVHLHLHQHLDLSP